MVPSGGDWAVHRGGSIYLTNTDEYYYYTHMY